MVLQQRYRWWIGALALSLVLAGCEGTDDVDQENNTTGDNQTAEDEPFLPPLEDLSTLVDGAIDNEELPDEAKADEIFPSSFDLMDVQSPVRNQGRRGVCSIFSTLGLVESLYIQSGFLEDPNFSEQYLQWSAKFEVGSFPNSSGSSALHNLRAVSGYGVVKEDIWPYQSSPWGASDDPECVGEESERPTRCHTNGEPTEEIRSAPKYRLPSGRWISTRTRDLQAHMYNNGQPVVVGGDFYYQAWNHGASSLPTNSDYSRAGYVLFPNDADLEASKESPAGHSILLVGWDDELEVERLDEEGNVMLDEDDNPLTEKGFFLFKNSWGTGNFGTTNPFGAGYGWISYEYVRRFKNARIADVPREEHLPVVEEELQCSDDQLECDDQCVASDAENCGSCGNTCAFNEICSENACVELEGEEVTFAYAGDEETIPDNDPQGLTTTIDVDGEGLIQELSVEIFIEHSFRGDIEIELTHPDGDSVTLREADGRSGWDIIEAYDVDEFIGLESQGTWELKVTDTAYLDEGSLVGWYLHMVR